MREEVPFNPLDKRHLGESVAEALTLREVGPLPPVEPFLVPACMRSITLATTPLTLG